MFLKLRLFLYKKKNDVDDVITSCETIISEYRDVDLLVANESILASVATLINKFLYKFAVAILRSFDKLIKVGKMIRKQLMSIADRYDEEYSNKKRKKIFKWDVIKNIVTQTDAFTKQFFAFDNKAYQEEGKLVDVVDTQLNRLKAYKEKEWTPQTIEKVKQTFDKYEAVDRVYLKDLRAFESVANKMQVTFHPKTAENDLVTALDFEFAAIAPLKNITFKDAGWPSSSRDVIHLGDYVLDLAERGDKVCGVLLNKGQKCYDNSEIFKQIVDDQKDKYTKDVLKLPSYIGQKFKEKSAHILVRLSLIDILVESYKRASGLIHMCLQNV